MNTKIKNIGIAMGIMLVVAFVAMIGEGGSSGAGNLISNDLASNKSDMFVEVCCVANDMGTWGSVLKFPVSVKVMSNSLITVSGANVTLRISGPGGNTGLVTIDGIPDYEYNSKQPYGGITKKTGSTGIAKFKVKVMTNPGIPGQDDYKLEVIVKKGSQIETYGMNFRAKGDF